MYASDSQTMGRGPLVGRGGIAGGPREVLEKISSNLLTCCLDNHMLFSYLMSCVRPETWVHFLIWCFYVLWCRPTIRQDLCLNIVSFQSRRSFSTANYLALVTREVQCYIVYLPSWYGVFSCLWCWCMCKMYICYHSLVDFEGKHCRFDLLQ